MPKQIPRSERTAVMHKFSVYVHHHPWPACRAKAHRASCPKNGLFLGCKLAHGSLRRGPDGKPIDTRVFACTHILPR